MGCTQKKVYAAHTTYTSVSKLQRIPYMNVFVLNRPAVRGFRKWTPAL